MGAQALPLLAAIARRETVEIVIASGPETALAVEVTP